MPNLIDANLHGGDQSEYLAQYMLSYLGAAAFVPRQEDNGIDFHCSLYKDMDERQRTFRSPFTLQLGSVKADKTHKKFIYGGVTNPKDTTKQKKHQLWEIDFLREQQLPFLVGTVDKSERRLRIYSTSCMWFVLHREDNVGEIELCPDADHDPLTESRISDLVTPTGALPRFRIPLGKPIVDVVITDIGTAKYKGAAEALKSVVEQEQKNLIYRTLGARTSWRAIDYEPNSPIKKWNYSFVPHPEIATVGLDWLRPVIITLAMKYKADNLPEKQSRVRGILELLPLSDIDKKILRDAAGIDFITTI